MPEVSLQTSEWVLKDLAKRGANVHLDTQLTSAVDGNVELSTGEVIPTDVIVWTAGVMANPTVVRGGDLPVEERGRIQTRADLRVGTPEAFVEVPGLRVMCRPSPTSRVAASAASACRTLSMPSVRRSSSRRTSWPSSGARTPRSTSTRTWARWRVSAVQRRLPVRQDRPQGLRGLGRAPRLPRPRDADVGAQVPRHLGLVEQPVAGSRPGEPRDGAEPALRLRGVRRASASGSSRGARGRCCSCGEGCSCREGCSGGLGDDRREKPAAKKPAAKKPAAKKPAAEKAPEPAEAAAK